MDVLSISLLSMEKTFLILNNRLEDLMLISCETDIVVNTGKVIDNFASSSPALTETLTFNYSNILQIVATVVK